ncbi:hypothetical protein BLNAU_7112 [Blattamonas nauphoetae]|uniref:Uncharacterized protein n=1 Tax=Blattamonas nauphoetae TaxID=2049346 RepID=A0ABQ9Y2I1_9EUKA|nr:hypothetical protein BLNAU_7112 [Blattamonas nauphoetae]
MFGSEAFQSGSSVSLIGVTHHSETCSLPPLVGLFHPPTQRRSTCNSDFHGPLHETEDGVTVIGMGLVFDSTSFSAGTGPLFSFGLSDEKPQPEVMHSLPMETTLIGSLLVNVTSRMVEGKNSLLFGGEVTQRVVGSEIGQSTNHDSGTAMMDGNLGGNVRCVNTSFWECRREGNTKPSFINENITLTHHIGRKVFDASSTATLISYSLCTFKDMEVAAGGGLGGGAAICIYQAVASLSVKDCFFLKCQVTAPNDDGGAINIRGTADPNQYFQLERSSFSECKSIGTNGNHAGCVFVLGISVTITDSFFEKSSAQYDGALTLYTNTHSILSNCAFVLCSASDRGGAVGVYHDATFSFSFLQFRDCTLISTSSAQDVFFYTLTFMQVPKDNFTHCDSTSGLHNVYFRTGSSSTSDLIPQITSPPTISDISIQFDDVRALATVSVTASKAIGGTMGILLDGCLVPRLVHVTFGSETEQSQTGSAVVSSGPRGVLPKEEYKVLNHSFAAVFLPPRIIHCVFSLKDSNTSVMIVNGWELEDGDYVMRVQGPDEVEKEISLSWVNSWTLNGTKLLYSSSATERLDWDTDYEVRSVVRRTQSEDTQIELSRIFQFTTPKEPIRVEGTDCSLGGEKEKAGVVEFWGVGLSGGSKYTLKVQKESSSGALLGDVIELKGRLSSESESGSFLHTEEIFGASSPRLSFGETYLVVGIVVGVDDGVVNEDVRFSVPSEPSRLTKITASTFTNTEKTEIGLSFETHALKGSTSYEMILQSIVGEGETGHEKTLVLTTNMNGEIDAISVILYPREEDETKLKGQLEFETRYEVKRVQKGSTEIHFETATTTFSTPIEPIRVEGTNCSLGGEKEKAGVVEF